MSLKRRSSYDERKGFMNSQLLQHYGPLHDCDLYHLERMKTGHMCVASESFVDHKNVLKSGKQIGLYQQIRYLQGCEHNHNYVEMVCTLKGNPCQIVNGEKIFMRPGELLLLSQQARHNAIPCAEEDITIYCNVLPQFFDKSMEMIHSTESALSRFLCNCRNYNPQNQNQHEGEKHLYFKTGGDLQIRNLLTNLLWSLTFDGCDSRNSDSFTMGLLMLHLTNLKDNEEYDFKQSALAIEVMKYIDERYVDGSLNDLAKQLCYEQSMLSKSIKRFTGSNFSRLIQGKRISQAKIMLETTDVSIANISKMVGYNNVGFFYQLFQEQVGCSPGEYRNQII